MNFPEKYWMKGEQLPNTNFFNPESSGKNNVEWVAPTARKVKQYDIPAKKGYVFAKRCCDILESLFLFVKP